MALKNIPEPADKSMVVIVEFDGDCKVIWRDDEKVLPGAHPDETWFDDWNGDSMSWKEITRYAARAHMVWPTPLKAEQ